MSTVKSSPFSSRTKSLRERFGSKRSYSESFKDPPVTASEPTGMGSPDLTTHRTTCPSIPAQQRIAAASTGQLRYSPMQQDEFNPYAALPEETYCSALDINSQEGDPRFPWQRDAAIQCDMSSEEASSYTTAGSNRGHSPDYRSSTVEGLLSAPHGNRNQSPTHNYSGRTRWGSEALPSSPQKESPKRRSMLQRAMSLERGRSKGGLKHQASLDETRETRTSVNKQMYVPHHVQTLTPSLESQVSVESSSPTSKDSLHSFNSSGGPVTSGHTSSNASVHSVTSSGSTTPSVTPPQSPPTSSACSRKPSLSERKKLGFLRKQTNSAPESFEDTTTPTPERPTPQATNYFNFECMQRLLEMSIKATGSQTGALAENRNFLLNIPTQARDGKSPAGYLSLPSPNLQGEENESSNVFKRLSSAGTGETNEEVESEQDEVQEEPPASALHRRRALVPPKMLTDGYESASEETDRSSMCHSQSHLNLPGDSKNRRRSSIVVIPPMQICPGDLLVYGKVLGNRNNVLDFDGSTQCLAGTDDASRKGKNTWSLLRLFDRSSRAKSDSMGGLEEVLSNIQPSEFIDGQLAKYKCMMWTDFVSHVEERVKKQSLTAQVRRTIPSRSPSETHSWATCPDADPPSTPPSFEMDEAIIYTPGPSSSSTSLPPPPQITVADVSASLSRSEDYGSNIRGDYANSSTSSQAKSSSSICDSVPMAGHTGMVWARAEQKRQELMWDLFQSKCMFLYDHLMVLKNVFMEPLKKIQVEGFAMFAEPEVLFGNLDELCLVTYAFCKEFLTLITQSIRNGDINATEILVKLFLKSSKATALTQAYHRYTLNYINALNYLETLRRQSEFNEFEKWCSRDPRCKKLQLTDLLVSPVQHIMRIPLIVKEIEMRTENMADRQTINAILEGEEHSLRELDDKMKWLKNFERLLEIQRNIVWPSVTELDPKAFIPEFLKGPLSKQPCERLIVSPRRQIILEGPLQLLDSGKPTEMYVLLFDDMLLITRRKKGLHKKKSSITENWASSCGRGGSIHESMFKYVVYKQPLSLDRFIIHDVNPQDGAANNLKNAFVLVCLNRFQQIYTVHSFQAPSESVKTTWLFKLRDTIDRWKRTLQNTVFRTNRNNLSNSGSVKVK